MQKIHSMFCEDHFSKLSLDAFGYILSDPIFLPVEVVDFSLVSSTWSQVCQSTQHLRLKTLIFKRWGHLQVQNIPSTALHFRNLPIHVAELFDLTKKYGTILSIRERNDHKTNQYRGNCILNTETLSGSKLLIDEFNCTMMQDKFVQVSYRRTGGVKTHTYGVGNVYIEGITSAVDEPMLFQYFRDFGEILSVALRLQEDGTPKGSAFVQYAKTEDAISAILKTDGSTVTFGTTTCPNLIVQPFLSKKVQRKKPETSKTVVIKMGKVTERSDLIQLLSPFGEITVVSILPHKWLAFVTFKESISALIATETLFNTHYLQDLAIHYISLYRSESPTPQYDEPFLTRCNVIVRFLTPEVDEEQLMNVFSEFGTILSVKVERDFYGCSRCFGYVLFEDSKSRDLACKRFPGRGVSGQKTSDGTLLVDLPGPKWCVHCWQPRHFRAQLNQKK